MKLPTLLLLALLCAGCSKPPELPPVVEGVSAEQIVPTLQAIAKTGEYQDVLTSLTAGLEKKGYMDQAVMVQNFRTMTPDQVKKAAGDLARKLEKKAS